VDLQRRIVFVVGILVAFPAQIAVQVHRLHVVVKLDIVEKEFFAEITPRVRQDFSSLLTARVSVLDVIA
jgi:hypothetical protein